MTESSDCRFCNQCKESLVHIIHECPRVQDVLPQPPHHELGPNFPTLGIVEHPRAIAKHRLRFSTLPEPSPITLHRTALWTDGSILWSDVFWLTCGGCAVIDGQGQTVFASSVQHWSLCSYTVDFFAVAAAFLGATNPVDIYSDCQTLVTHFQMLTTGIDIPNRWNTIKRIWDQRRAVVESPAEVIWIPSHTFDNIPFELITEEMPVAKKTNIQHVRGNRIADLVAEEQAAYDAAVAVADKVWLQTSVAGRQEWLVALNKRFADDVTVSKNLASSEIANNNAEINLEELFPRWPWHANFSSYITAIDVRDVSVPAKWKWSHDAWIQLTRFATALKWHVNDDKEVAFIDLTFLFRKRGFRRTEFDMQSPSIRDLHQMVRKGLRELQRLNKLPGEWMENHNKSWGKHLPTGCIRKAMPWFSHDELQSLGHLLMNGAGGKMSSWSFSLAETLQF